MENAAKFSPPDAAVQVQARELDGQLRIDVIDAGPGIPDDERARIFDMFYSVERGDRGRHAHRPCPGRWSGPGRCRGGH
ncbi:sensor histidine kinase, partial [Enterobacter hormaechei]|uniref:sensor histidine kinase n=1 Tax=Enterobacter hormaechei TaxID=158836 RepID=UPI0020413276